MSDLDKLEEKIRNYALNWPKNKLDVFAVDLVELLDERDSRISALENKIRILQSKDK